MTKKEQAELSRLRVENVKLKAEVDKLFGIYRDQLFEIVDIRTKLELVEQAINGAGE
jgi:hypothetical protein